MDEIYKFEDESGDKKYFTIIPNYILNHSTPIAQALYLQLKRLAGENGLAYPSRTYLLKHLHIHVNTLKKEISYLLEKGWIEYIGFVDCETLGGIQKMKAYKIKDIWKLNNLEYSNSLLKNSSLKVTYKRDSFKNKGGSNKNIPSIKGGSNKNI